MIVNSINHMKTKTNKIFVHTVLKMLTRGLDLHNVDKSFILHKRHE